MPRYQILLASLLLAALFASPAFAASEAVLGARYPALSPGGETVVFAYWGDLWSAPVDGSEAARRLTDHLAFDQNPRFSPDGESIAFEAGREGSSDVWVMPAEGGVPRRVTGFSGGDTLMNWSPDGRRIVFTSKRELWATNLMHIDVAGKEPPVQVTYRDHYSIADAVMLPDGGFIVSRGSGRWWRKHYRGTSQQELWRIHPDGTHEQLTDHPGYDRWPMLGADGNTVYYVTDLDGIPNIWSMNLEEDLLLQVTHHTYDGVQFPSIDPTGKYITYEFAGDLYILSLYGNALPRKLSITVNTEPKSNLITKKTFRNDADEYAVSPHGKYVVVAVDGDLWAVRDPKAYKDDEKPDQDLAKALRLTASDGSRERNPAFCGDNRRIAYASDEDGDYEIYLMDLSDLSVTQVTNDDVDNLVPKFDPADENGLFYYTGSRQLMRHDLASGESKLVHEASYRHGFGYRGYSISPDGRWIAVDLELPDWSTDLFIIDVEGEQEPVNITRHPDYEGSPRWSADGRRLCYMAIRRDRSGIYVVDLDPEAEEYDMTFLFDDDLPGDDEEDEADEEAGDGDEEENGDDENGDDDEEAKDEEKDDDEDDDEDKVEVVIDFEDIHLRARRVSTQDNAGSPMLSADGEWAIYTTDPDNHGTETWAVKAEGGSAKKLKDGYLSSRQWADKGKRIYFRDGGTVRYLKFSNGSAKGTETIDASGEYWLDQRLRWRQMFREGWRTLGERFYDENMHGTDWDAMYDKYAPFIDHIGTPEEFGLVFSELLGELNGSHLGISMREQSFSGSGIETGHLGLEFDETFKGPGLLISHVTYQGPADRPGVGLSAGMVVEKIDGAPVQSGMRWLDELNDKAGELVTLTVRDAADEEETREVVMKATSFGGYQSLLYREWEIMNEELVDELSGGRIGYIHIRGMSGTELRKFEREFHSELFDRDALIVDVRFNPGGMIHEPLLDLLDRNVFGWAHDRGGEMIQQPGRVFKKPKALLINARSGSDAEIFPAGWRILGLGPVIGIDTAGAVIGTTGFTLIDGSYVRLPVNGWYELDGRNLELSGTPPDIYIDVHPDELRAGKDVQLERAVETLLLQLD